MKKEHIILMILLSFFVSGCSTRQPIVRETVNGVNQTINIAIQNALIK